MKPLSHELVSETFVLQLENCYKNCFFKDIFLKNNNINLEGSCGGEMLCSTCHVYILSNHLNKLKKKTKEEKEILALSKNLKNNSRLACQIKIIDKLNGLIFSAV